MDAGALFRSELANRSIHSASPATCAMAWREVGCSSNGVAISIDAAERAASTPATAASCGFKVPHQRVTWASSDAVLRFAWHPWQAPTKPSEASSAGRGMAIEWSERA